MAEDELRGKKLGPDEDLEEHAKELQQLKATAGRFGSTRVQDHIPVIPRERIQHSRHHCSKA